MAAANEFSLLIDGQWRDGSLRTGEDVLNPATGESIGHVAHASMADLDEALGLGHTGRRVAKHARDHEWFFSGGFRDARGRCGDHAADRAGGVFKNDARHAVDAGHIDDRRHHRDVAGADAARKYALTIQMMSLVPT